MGSDIVEALRFVNVGVDLHTLTSRANLCSVTSITDVRVVGGFGTLLHIVGG